MKREDFHSGQIVWVLLGGIEAQGKDLEECIQKWTVIKVGRRYITARPNDGIWEHKFDMENNFRHVHTYGTADYTLFLNREEIYKRHEKAKKISYIQNACSSCLSEMSDDDFLIIYDIFKKYEAGR